MNPGKNEFEQLAEKKDPDASEKEELWKKYVREKLARIRVEAWQEAEGYIQAGTNYVRGVRMSFEQLREELYNGMVGELLTEIRDIQDTDTPPEEIAFSPEGNVSLEEWKEDLRKKLQLVWADGTLVLGHWAVLEIGEDVVIKTHTFRVAHIGESYLVLEPVGPVVVGTEEAKEETGQKEA